MRRRFELKQLPVWPVARTAFIVLLAVGILVGILYGVMCASFGFLAGILGDAGNAGELLMFQRLGFVMIPMIAVFYAVFGTIGVVIVTVVYNLAAGAFGGITLVLEDGTGPGRSAAPAAERENDI